MNKKGIHFDPVKHIYTNAQGEKYISGTKFISLFKQSFDGDFWKKYKAVQRLLEEADRTDVWKRVKMKYLKTEDKSLFFEAAYKEVSPAKVQKLIKIINQEWEVKKNDSLNKGTKYHDGEEEKLRKEYNHTHDWNWLDISYPNLKPTIYPELRLYNHEHKIAGSADKIAIFKNGEADIIDYKTNRELKFESWTNPWTKNENKMKDPVEILDDCNFSHYTLQLSLYGWMMEELGYKIRDLKILHVIFNEEGKPCKTQPYKVEYMKNSIIKMLEYYNKKLV